MPFNFFMQSKVGELCNFVGITQTKYISAQGQVLSSLPASNLADALILDTVTQLMWKGQDTNYSKLFFGRSS